MAVNEDNFSKERGGKMLIKNRHTCHPLCFPMVIHSLRWIT